MQKQIIEKAIELGFSKHIYEFKQNPEVFYRIEYAIFNNLILVEFSEDASYVQVVYGESGYTEVTPEKALVFAANMNENMAIVFNDNP